MLTLVFAAVLAGAPAERPSPAAASASAQAVVRIVRGAEVRFGKGLQFEASIPRETTLRERDGSIRSASLIEFY
jgi:hypothetical protein